MSLSIEYEEERVGKKGTQVVRKRGRKKRTYMGQVAIANLSGREMSEKINRLAEHAGFVVGGGVVEGVGRRPLSLEDEVDNVKLRKEKVKAEVDLKKAERELEEMEGSGRRPPTVIWPTYDHKGGKFLIKSYSLNPGEVKTIGEVEVDKKGEKKGEASDVVNAVTATTKAIQTGVELGQSVSAGGTSSDEVRRIVEDKLETYTAKSDTKFATLRSDIISKIEEIDRGGGNLSELMDILDRFGLLKKKGEVEGEDGKKGSFEEALDFLDRLEQKGFIKLATKNSGEAHEHEMEKLKESHAYDIAKKRLEEETAARIAQQTIERGRTKVLQDFTKDIGGAVADAMEEEEEDEDEDEGHASTSTSKIEESKKTKSGIEQFICEVCKATVSIPPEAQVVGTKLICPKCNSEYNYTEE